VFAFGSMLDTSDHLWTLDYITGREALNREHRFDKALDWRLFTLYENGMPLPHWWVRFTRIFPEFVLPWKVNYVYGQKH
jgi:hypothetical protein